MKFDISFTAKIEKVPTESGWHIIRLPADILQTLRSTAGKNGNTPILATIGKTTWQTTTMSMGEQQWFFAVNAQVRKTENLSEGDSVDIYITLDRARLKTAKNILII